MHSTGLFPFKANWPELNKEKFKLADTLDRTEMDAKIAAHNAELSFSEGYRSFQISCNDLNASLTEVGPVLKEILPSLYASLNEFLLNRIKHEAVLKLGATIFRIPDNTKVIKTGPPRKKCNRRAVWAVTHLKFCQKNRRAHKIQGGSRCTQEGKGRQTSWWKSQKSGAAGREGCKAQGRSTYSELVDCKQV